MLKASSRASRIAIKCMDVGISPDVHRVGTAYGFCDAVAIISFASTLISNL